MKINPLTAIDFYKADHRRQYPKGTTEVYSNFTARSSKLANVIRETFDEKVVFFGLQYFIKEFLIETWNENFFNRPKLDVLFEYKKRMDNALGKDAVEINHIGFLHDLGYLPIRIKALPEGSRVPIRVPLFTVVNTHPDFFWITNYIESVMSSYLWKPITSATTAFEYKKILTKYAIKTGSQTEFVKIQAHDFSFRGMSGPQDAALSGSGHLTSFVGTDSVLSIDLIENYYCADSNNEVIGVSVPATEHSVMSLGSQESEIETFRRLINETYPAGFISIVSDTWDFWKVLTEYLPVLKSEIMARDGTVVIRPDSGDPVDIICGTCEFLFEEEVEAIDFFEDRHHSLAKDDCEGSYNVGSDSYIDYCMIKGDLYEVKTRFEYNRHDKEYYYIDCYGDNDGIPKLTRCDSSPELKGAIQVLWETFGGTINDKGYKVLDEHIGLIYGDSITLERAEEILKRLESKGFASSNIVFGVGSYTYQYCTRDNFGFAMKATSGVVNGQRRDIFKNPKTDDGTKKSAKGLLRVELEEGEYVLHDQQTNEQELLGELKVIFEDGILVNPICFQKIRDNIERYLD